MAKAGFDISLIGDKKLIKKLKKIDKKIASKMLQDAMKTAMEPVKSLAKQRSPVKKGLLRRSIRIAVTRSRTGKRVVVRTGTRRQLRIDPNDKYYYPAAHEYGTRFLPVRSFLRSALADRRNIVLNSLSSEIRRLLRSVI